MTTSFIISGPPSPTLLSLPPEILLLIADQVALTSYPSISCTPSSCTLTFCTDCSLPIISDFSKISLVAFGLAHPYLFALFKERKRAKRCHKNAPGGDGCVEGGFEWLYRCWRWLSDRPRKPRTPYSGCERCHQGYTWQGNWLKLKDDAYGSEPWERVLCADRKHVSILTTDQWYVWRHCKRG